MPASGCVRWNSKNANVRDWSQHGDHRVIGINMTDPISDYLFGKLRLKVLGSVENGREHPAVRCAEQSPMPIHRA